MKTYVQPWISKIDRDSSTVLLSQSSDKILQVSQTEITDSDQILSKEAQLFDDLWGDSWEEDHQERE